MLAPQKDIGRFEGMYALAYFAPPRFGEEKSFFYSIAWHLTAER